jgi:hypothetical protein
MMPVTPLPHASVDADPPWSRSRWRRAALLALDTAALMRSLGCQVLGCHAHQGETWLRVRLPARADAATRARILARHWSAQATIEWIG